MKKHNFSAGPSILPKYTLEECAKAIQELGNTGLSILEISHRSNEFIAILEETEALFRELLEIPSNYDVLFLQGGASLQFYMVPLNLLRSKALYLETGVWAEKAIQEAQKIGKTEIVASSKDKNFSYIPHLFNIDTEADYLHITTNNTIYGTQIHHNIKSPIPIVADMSSDILSKRINVNDFDLIYAGAQKNIGPAGLTIVILKNNILGTVNRTLPSMLDYSNYVKNQSMYNTPPTFAIFAALQTLKWLKINGGIDFIEKQNQIKAQILYDEIERNTLFKSDVAKENRSLMNVTFNLLDTNLENKFLSLCDKNNISGIKGHRAIGGFRASIYNAMPLESIKTLIETMQNFEQLNN